MFRHENRIVAAKLLMFVIAGACVALLYFHAREEYGDDDPSRCLLVARNDISAYTPLKLNDFETHQTPAPAMGDQLTRADWDRVVAGRILKIRLAKGTTLRAGDLYDPSCDNLRDILKTAEIAMTMPIGGNAISGSILPGSIVDVEAVTVLPTPDGGTSFSTIVLEGVEVLATNESMGVSDKSTKVAATATLRLTRDQALLLSEYEEDFGCCLRVVLKP